MERKHLVQKTAKDKEAIAWGKKNFNEKHTDILFACHPHQVPVIQVLTSCECVRVCGEGVATHKEMLVYEQTMEDTAA